MFKKVYFLSLMIVSFTCCALFSTIAVATYLQDPTKLEERTVVVFRVDSTFSQCELRAIRDAMSRWVKASKGRLVLAYYTDKVSSRELFTWALDGIPTIYNSSSILSWERHVAQYLTASTYGVLGATLTVSGDIFMIDDTPGKFEVIVAHEIGHVLLGAYHSGDTKSLMFPKLGSDYKTKTLTEADIKLLDKMLRKEKK